MLDLGEIDIKHKLELSQAISILTGDESLEDVGPRSTTSPIFNAGQQPLIEEISRLQTAMKDNFMVSNSAKPADLAALGRIIGLRRLIAFF